MPGTNCRVWWEEMFVKRVGYVMKGFRLVQILCYYYTSERQNELCQLLMHLSSIDILTPLYTGGEP